MIGVALKIIPGKMKNAPEFSGYLSDNKQKTIISKEPTSIRTNPNQSIYISTYMLPSVYLLPYYLIYQGFLIYPSINQSIISIGVALGRVLVFLYAYFLVIRLP